MHPLQPLTILTIPIELAHHILSFCDPGDVIAFCRTCHAAFEIIQDDYLWQQLWHAYPFDDPQLVGTHRQAVHLPKISVMSPFGDSWKAQFIRRMRAEHVALKKREHYSSLSVKQKKAALQVFVSVLDQALPAIVGDGLVGKPLDIEVSDDFQWVQQVLSRSRLIAPVLQSLEDEEEISELQARVRSYLDDYEWGGRTRRALSDRRNRSRAFVYDLRNYSQKNNYGPYHADGTVNWIHVENIANVILSNLRELPIHFALTTQPPSGLESLRPYSAPGKYSSRDWAGERGVDTFASWTIEIFLFSDVADGPLHPNFFEDPRFREATRLIEVRLHIVPESQIRFYPPSEIEPSASLKHPITFFHGTSKGVNGNEAVVEGYVRVATDGSVRWRLLSIYDNSPQWSSCGLQIGDVGSARGGVGVWTTTTHEQGDPVGPFWFWKVEDDCSEELVEYT
ncbi:hypothetical protein NP233_g795 [Leucocoprinus birnbaumii]|uniref:F-box domain-containing protein n=1 Tax=Leucocoprinus birnbaumii TaxID=56174 RepID=A0AAD5W6E2_9AGAR|nr:hypothetical protein NP233_g795 [Leucocoprinus birnbaumii]